MSLSQIFLEPSSDKQFTQKIFVIKDKYFIEFNRSDERVGQHSCGLELCFRFFEMGNSRSDLIEPTDSRTGKYRVKKVEVDVLLAIYEYYGTFEALC